MKVKLLVSVGIGGQSSAKGEVITVDKSVGDKLVWSNKAVEVKAKARVSKK